MAWQLLLQLVRRMAPTTRTGGEHEGTSECTFLTPPPHFFFVPSPNKIHPHHTLALFIHSFAYSLMKPCFIPCDFSFLSRQSGALNWPCFAILQGPCWVSAILRPSDEQNVPPSPSSSSYCPAHLMHLKQEHHNCFPSFLAVSGYFLPDTCVHHQGSFIQCLAGAISRTYVGCHC